MAVSSLLQRYCTVDRQGIRVEAKPAAGRHVPDINGENPEIKGSTAGPFPSVDPCISFYRFYIHVETCRITNPRMPLMLQNYCFNLPSLHSRSRNFHVSISNWFRSAAWFVVGLLKGVGQLHHLTNELDVILTHRATADIFPYFPVFDI